MKYVLKRDLPLAKAGTEVVTSDSFYYQKQELDIHLSDDSGRPHCIATIKINDIPEWLEEVKEPKTIYDLKEGDEYYLLDSILSIGKYKVTNEGHGYDNQHINNFLTEREAKRNKLLRELATRTTKYMPRRWTNYINYEGELLEFEWTRYHFMMYNMGFIFRDKEEYNKWMTDEARKLLLNI